MATVLMATAVRSATFSPVKLNWSLQLPATAQSSPAIGNGGDVYVSTDDGTLTAVTQNGTLRWCFETAALITRSPAIGADGTIYLATRGFAGGELFSVSADGAPIWTFHAPEPFSSTPAIGPDGTLYLGSTQKLYAVSSDGELLWTFDPNPPFPISSPAVGVDGTVYFASSTIYYALRPDGTLKWTFDTGTVIERAAAIGADGSIYVPTLFGLVVAINPNGTEKWTSQVGVFASPPVIADDNTVYFGGSDGLFAFHTTDGELKWTLSGAVRSAAAIGADGTVYVQRADEFTAVRPDGSVKWTLTGVTCRAGVASPAIDEQGNIYRAAGRNLYSIAANSGGLGSTPWPMWQQNPRHTGRSNTPFIITTLPRILQFGRMISQQLEVFPSNTEHIWSVTSGELPPGITLQTDGTFIGTPSQVGQYKFTIQATGPTGDPEREFIVDVALTAPLPNIRITKTGTTPVPGRIVDRFLTVENGGETIATDVEVVEFLDPAVLNLGSVEPAGIAEVSEFSSASLIVWNIPALGPGELEVMQYRAQVRASVPRGTIATGGPGCSVALGDIPFGDDVLESGTLLSLWGECLLDAAGTVNSCKDCFLQRGVCSCIIALRGVPFVIPQGAVLWLGCLSACTACLIRTDGGGENCIASISSTVRSCFDALVETFNEERGNPVVCEANPQEVVGPVDPNEKCVVAERFVTSDRSLVYPIHFENIGEVEAIDVFITDVLSPVLDLTTVDVISPGGSVQTSTRTVRWDLLGIDLEPGETGNVLFSVKPRSGLPSGTKIINDASIQFEVFEPIHTNKVVNIIDDIPPSCVVNGLPAVSPSGGFEVSWVGEDPVGEIESYEVFVSEDGDPFRLFFEGAGTRTRFQGRSGSTYDFFCVAADTAGNTEEGTAAAEASTRVSAFAPCVPEATTLCLSGGRFRVEVEWEDFDGNVGVGRAVEAPAEDSGIFWFFDEDNWEMLLKVLDGCSINRHFWVFSAATTNVAYTLRVTDTATGVVKEYVNPLGRAAKTITDTGAFSTCP